MRIAELLAEGYPDTIAAFSAVADANQVKKTVDQYRDLVNRNQVSGTERNIDWWGRQNRAPRDSSRTVQQYFNQCLKQLGFTALRSNSIFATSDYDHAEKFGDPYAIFPLDNRSAYTYTNQYDITLSSRMKDTHGNVVRVPINDPRIASGELRKLKNLI